MKLYNKNNIISSNTINNINYINIYNFSLKFTINLLKKQIIIICSIYPDHNTSM